MVIPQAARRFFYIGFQMENRVAVAAKPFPGEALELRMQQRPGLFFRAQQYFGVEFIEKLRIAIQKPAVEHCQMKLGVGFLDVAAFLQRAACGADAKPEVPESA